MMNAEQRRTFDSRLEIVNISIEKITDNPFQPRKRYSKGDIDSLANNISNRGLLHPINVAKNRKGIYYNFWPS